MTYEQGQKVVDAQYGHMGGNPFMEAMPDLLPREEYLTCMESHPKLPPDLPVMTIEQRRQLLPIISTAFYPMDYMYAIYDQLYRAIVTTYTTRTAMESITQINALFAGKQCEITYATQAASGSILGVPGVGKTSTIKRSLALMPQVIAHTEYKGQPFYCKQVLYLHIECPSDCSVKTLAYNILQALDVAIGSDYFQRLTAMKTAAASAIAMQVKILCITHHVGLLVVDEIQNAVLTARKNGQVKPLIKFLVELTNDTCTGIIFAGTPFAEELFLSEEHLKRRTRGVRLLPLRPDGVYFGLLKALWPLQMTPKQAPLSDGMRKKLFDLSGGIPAYISKIFMEAQAQALLSGEPCITEKIMQRAVDILAIKIPKTYSGGTYLSDFTYESEREPPAEEWKISPEETQPAKEVPRLYAEKRGRKAADRDPEDLLVAFREGRDMVAFLRQNGMLEDREC